MRVNSTYSTLTHQPLVLLRHDTSYSQLLALLHVADVFMVTALREGMNLTCHEYIYCQDGTLLPNDPHCYGCLVLSEFTGSASVFAGHELLVNPWDFRQCADTLNKALEMTPEQKRQDWEYLHNRMAPHTAISWCKSFHKALSVAHGLMQLSREPDRLSASSIESLKLSYHHSSLRLFFFDDESITNGDKSTRKQRRALLRKLADDPHNLVYLTSDKSPEELEPLIDNGDEKPAAGKWNVGLVAEDGYFWRQAGKLFWKPTLDTDVESVKGWKEAVKRVMEYSQERIDGSWIQEKHFLVIFRFDQAADPETASRQASELADQLGGSWGVHKAIRVTHGEGAVTFKPSETTEATVANMILQHLRPRAPDLVLVAGAERSDEDLFQWANEFAKSDADISATTLLLGSRATRAKATLPDESSLATLIDGLCSAK